MMAAQPITSENKSVDSKSKKRKLDYDSSIDKSNSRWSESSFECSVSSVSQTLGHTVERKPKNEICTNDTNDGMTNNISDPIDDADSIVKQLHLDLRKDEERLRKLNMVKKYREKNNLEELAELIDKWRGVCQQSFEDLLELLPPPRPSPKELLDHLQIDYDLVHFDVESEAFT